MRNPYEILGVNRNSTEKEIKKAYLVLAKKYHPDVNKDDGAVEKFKEAAEAHEILGDPQKKAQYDRFGSVGRNSFSGGKPYTSTMDDFLSSMFGREHSIQTRGEHIIIEHEIELVDVLNGGATEIKYHRHSLCKICNGTGGDQIDCKHCGGSGKRIIRGQAMIVQTVCPACEGTGKSIERKCESCQNGFTGPEDKTSSFDIPKGVEAGMRFCFRGEGEPCMDGISGNLYVVVHVKPHDIFERLPNGGILCKMPVSYTQLVLGDEVEVPTLDGVVKLKIPKDTQSGTKFRLKGQGLPIFNNYHDDIYNGDELVQVELSLPTEISDEHMKLLERLANIERTGE